MGLLNCLFVVSWGGNGIVGDELNFSWDFSKTTGDRFADILNQFFKDGQYPLLTG